MRLWLPRRATVAGQPRPPAKGSMGRQALQRRDITGISASPIFSIPLGHTRGFANENGGTNTSPPRNGAEDVRAWAQKRPRQFRSLVDTLALMPHSSPMPGRLIIRRKWAGIGPGRHGQTRSIRRNVQIPKAQVLAREVALEEAMKAASMPQGARNRRLQGRPPGGAASCFF